jgi:hypothetical protein
VLILRYPGPAVVTTTKADVFALTSGVSSPSTLTSLTWLTITGSPLVYGADLLFPGARGADLCTN